MTGAAAVLASGGPHPARLAAARAACARLARRHYENFTVGSWLLPRAVRQDLAAVYAFARGADDVADEGAATPAERLATLAEWARRLEACAADPWSVEDPVFLALGHAIRTHDLPVSSLRDLLEAFRRDAAGASRRFATFADVLDYCRYSANPVGRLVLALFGARDPALHADADAVCTGLQLVNFWQDVRGDLARDRVYLPDEDLERFPGSREALASRRATPGFRALLGFECARARDLLEQGHRLAGRVRGRLRREVRVFAGGGLAVLDRLAAVEYDVFARRPSLGRADLARVVLRSLW
jgi:squalene synthase HpnC